MTIPIMYQEEFERAIKSHKLTDLYPLSTRISKDVGGDRMVYDNFETLCVHIGYCLAKHNEAITDYREGRYQTTQEILDELE